jgi:TonB family protein
MARCGSCGESLTPGSSPAGLCARCLLATALADDDDARGDAAGTTVEPGTLIGSFRIASVVGRGGMSTVYEALDARLDRAVALKVLPPEFLHDPKFAERFDREARVVAALEHPNIVPIYASGIDAGIPWMSMRLMTGGTVANLIEQGRPAPVRVVELLRSVANALDYAHHHGIVHRDIKPSNVLLDAAGGIFVGDFGLAYMIEVSSRMTQAGLIAGTPEYMAPEQALGNAVDHRADIYSLAMLAYEMFAGAPPFIAASPVATLLKHVNESLPVPAGIPGAVMRVIQTGGAKNPEERWPSATAFVDALAQAISTPPPLVLRRRSIQAAAAVAVLATAAAAGWLAERAPASVTPVSIDVPSESIIVEPVSKPTPSDQERPRQSPAVASPAQHAPPPSKRLAAQPQAVMQPVPEPPVRPLADPIDVNTIESPPSPASERRSDGGGVDQHAVRDVLTPPARLRTVAPEYPQVARAAQLEGDVVLEALVTAEGAVTNVTVVRSIHPLLDAAARNAVLRYEYAPGRRNDVPEAAVVRVTVSFRMR